MKTCRVEVLACVTGHGVTPTLCERMTGLVGTYAWSRDAYPDRSSWGLSREAEVVDVGDAVSPLLAVISSAEGRWLVMLAENPSWRSSLIVTITVELDPTSEDYPRIAFEVQQVHQIARLKLAIDVTFR